MDDIAISDNSKRTWRYVFLAGVLACIISGFVVLDSTVFASIIALSTLAIGVINSLISPAGQNPKEQNWVVSKLKHGLDVGRFLKTATVLVWLVTIGITSYGALRYYYESKKITIEGYVIAASGEPATNALVTLFLTGRKESLTTPDGKFTFARIDISNEPSKQLRLEVVWHDTKKEETIDLSSGALKGLTIKLPPGNPPFRVSYYLLEGDAIDLVVRGEINSKWEKTLGGQPYIVPNGVLIHLRNLIKQFSIPFQIGDGAGIRIDKTDKDNKTSSSYDDQAVTRYEGKPLFQGSSGDSFSVYDLSANDVASMLRSKQQWGLEAIPDKVRTRNSPTGFDLSSLYFWKFASHEDFGVFERQRGWVNKRLEFYKHITKDSLPDDFLLYVITNSTLCGEDELSTEAYLIPRRLRLRVAVVENISPQSIHFGKFTVRENVQESLRARREDESLINAKAPEQQGWFPQEVLKPQERLLIPIEMPMAYDEENNELVGFLRDSFHDKNRAGERARLARQLSALDRIKFSVGEIDSRTPFMVKASDINEILAQPTREMNFDKEYMLGPSVNIETVMVNNVDYPFRQYSSSKLAVLLNGVGIGSCPYVYTYSSANGAWVNEGHILFNLNNRLKETTEEMRLSRFDGRILLKEKDPEISYIDFMHIKAVSLDGNEQVFYPSNLLLRAQDGKYLILRRGEEAEIKFDIPAGFRAARYFLIIRGYYTPLHE